MGDKPGNPGHNEGENSCQHYSNLDESVVPSPEGSDDSDVEGTWEDRNAGYPSQRMTMEDFEALRPNLTPLSKKRSQQDCDGPG